MSKYPSIGNGAADSRRHSMARYWSPNQRRIRVEVVHRAYQPRQRNAIPPRSIALLIIAVLMWVSPFGAVIAIVMASVLIASHPDVWRRDRRHDRAGDRLRAARAVARPAVLNFARIAVVSAEPVEEKLRVVAGHY